MHLPYSSEYSLTCIPESFRLGVGATENIVVEFKPNSVGAYQTIINSLVNNMHTVPVIFRANVMFPNLTPNNLNTVINLHDPFPSTFLTLSNVLNVPVQYAWNISATSCFDVRPKTGTIAPQRATVSEIRYQLDYSARFSSKLKLECIHGLRQSISSTIFVDKLDIVMREKLIEAPHIPLNTAYYTKAVILNRSCQPVYYNLKNPRPLSGISITPVEGIINRKSYQSLTIVILIENIISFRCAVSIDIHATITIGFTICGKVEFPDLVFAPETISMKRIVAGSFDVQHFSMYNAGKSPVSPVNNPFPI